MSMQRVHDTFSLFGGDDATGVGVEHKFLQVLCNVSAFSDESDLREQPFVDTLLNLHGLGDG
jgi:hypothetical protein